MKLLSFRELKIGMDQLKFVASWSSGKLSGVKVSVKVKGLMIEGATFDGQSLRENSHNSPTISTVPTATVAWIPKDQPDLYSPSESVLLPLYSNELREKVVISITLPCDKHVDGWIIAGTALIMKSQ